jgi:hypothetical protein
VTTAASLYEFAERGGAHMSREQSVQPYSLRLTARVHAILLSTWLAIALVVPATAENGRDFSALYDLGAAHPVDTTHVSLQLYLSLQNHGATSVGNTAIFLAPPSLVETDWIQIADGVTIARRAVARVSGTVTIDAQEYQRWQRGQWAPLLFIRITDAQGHQIDRRIELVRRPGLGARQ